MSVAIKVMIVDDHPLAREGVIRMLHAFGGRFKVVAEAGQVEEALSRVEVGGAEVVVTDLHFDQGPGEQANGVDLIRSFGKRHPAIKCLVLTSEQNDAFMVMAHDAGACGYLSKASAAEDIARAIESVASGFTHFPAQLKVALDQREHCPGLTPREAELVPYIAKGMTAKEIARELTYLAPENPINDRTVETHKGNIKQKFHLGSANALVAYCIEHCQSHRNDYKKMLVHTKRFLF
jgi:two-component system, NarL family, nitrate/nitrite response regulator NarL